MPSRPHRTDVAFVTKYAVHKGCSLLGELDAPHRFKQTLNIQGVFPVSSPHRRLSLLRLDIPLTGTGIRPLSCRSDYRGNPLSQHTRGKRHP